MGLFFTLLFVITAYLAPVTLFGELAEYHLEILIALAGFLFSALVVKGSRVSRMAQTWAVVGLSFAVACSISFNGNISGGPMALMEFLPSVGTFFLVFLNCRKKGHLQALVGLLFFCAVFIVFQSQEAVAAGEFKSPYLLSHVVNEETKETLVRIRGLSFLSDPNDLAQFMVSLIPCLFLFWTRKKSAGNLFFVYLPAGFLVYGVYLTHSRGGMVALMVAAMVAFRKKIGLVPSAIAGGLVFVGLSVAGFSGGRDVSAGEDRIGAWSTGLDLIRTHPIFGVGYGKFPDFYEITAHNTFVVCAAELGLAGVFCWILFILVTVRNVFAVGRLPAETKQKAPLGESRLDGAEATALAGPGRVLVPSTSFAFEAPHPMLAAPGASFGLPPGGFPGARTANPAGFPTPEEEKAAADDEVRRMCGLMVISFAAFLTAGWFLSRAYTIVLYVNAGMAAAVYRMASDRGIAPPAWPARLAMKYAAWLVLALLVVVYLIVRVDHLMPKQ